MEEETPRFTHDCDGCIFLGRYDQPDNGYDHFDLYYCPRGGPTVIGRFGNEGPEYCSGLEIARAGKIPPLVEALRRAQEKGLEPKPSGLVPGKQYIKLYIDKIRGLSRFEAVPRPPLPQYREAVQMWTEEAAKDLQQFVGQIFSPNTVAGIVAVSRHAIQMVLNMTGMELEFEHFLISPGEFDDRGFNDGKQKTAYDILREAQLKREGKW